MVKKATSIKIDSELWKEVKKHCIDQEIEVSSYLEKLLVFDLKNKKVDTGHTRLKPAFDLNTSKRTQY
ncbi:MAG TPA: hypothetical protein VJJ82_05195 [Candidatus Nanoarchaeia archaeon]|nr:hypothetical protein [Candidatus Nanoarchaeia archaeon]